MRGLRLLAASALALVACAPSPPNAVPQPVATATPQAPPPTEAPPAALDEAQLHGRWRIVSLNGAAPVGASRGGEREPHLVFSPGFYGGSTGCNAFGGLGLLEGDRYYGSPAGQTAIGCGDLTAQEDAIIRIVTASPRVDLAPDGVLSLAGGPGRIVLRRDAGGAVVPPAPSGPALLAGSSWTIGGIDGRWVQGGERRSLRFEADRWSLSGACGTAGGRWRQSGDRIEAQADPLAPRTCTADAAALDERLMALLAARPRFVTGPNGEILIGGGGHWATGERPRTPLADEAALLAGGWRIVAIDGAPPAAGSDPRIGFGPTGYSGSAGCNSFQGYHLAHARRLFSPPPMQTEMSCGPVLNAQEARVSSLLSGAPVIALAGGGEIALSDATGGLRLRREAPAARWAPVGRYWNGEPLRAELTMLDGVPLQARYGEPETLLRLTAQRFDIATGCGRLGGIRRSREGAWEFLTDPEPGPSGACAGALASRLETFMRLFNGRGRILIGASGELILAGERHWLGGRVLPTATRRR